MPEEKPEDMINRNIPDGSDECCFEFGRVMLDYIKNKYKFNKYEIHIGIDGLEEIKEAFSLED